MRSCNEIFEPGEQSRRPKGAIVEQLVRLTGIHDSMGNCNGGAIMSRAPFIAIDGRLYRWKDILELRRAQLAAAGAAEASQLALFATLHDDCRPPADRTASRRYLEPGLFAN
jgi:hypothetical protein